MSSLLHRLAERAMGRTRPLRSLAQGPVRGAESSAEVGDVPMPVAPWDVSPPAVARAREEPPLQAQPDQRVATTGTRQNMLHVQASPVRSAPFARPAEHAGAEDSDVVTPKPLRSEPSRLLPTTMLRNAPPLKALHAQNPDPLDPPSDPPRTTGPDEPPPLMPLLSRAEAALTPHLPFRIQPAKPEGRQTGSAVEETTEVHISIGRIEVTAVQAPVAATQAVPRRRQAPMSLDDYIARRQGGRS